MLKIESVGSLQQEIILEWPKESTIHPHIMAQQLPSNKCNTLLANKCAQYGQICAQKWAYHSTNLTDRTRLESSWKEIT